MSDDLPPAEPDAPPTDRENVDRADAAADDRETDDLVDLDRIAADLDGVEAALQRLDSGTYWTDEVTGQPIADSVLDTDPVARRNPDPA